MAPRSPPNAASQIRARADFNGHWRDGISTDALILESWSEGFMVGALVIMACITVAAMRKGMLLHKLILLEVGLFQALCPAWSYLHTLARTLSLWP